MSCIGKCYCVKGFVLRITLESYNPFVFFNIQFLLYVDIHSLYIVVPFSFIWLLITYTQLNSRGILISYLVFGTLASARANNKYNHYRCCCLKGQSTPWLMREQYIINLIISYQERSTQSIELRIPVCVVCVVFKQLSFAEVRHVFKLNGDCPWRSLSYRLIWKENVLRLK